MNGHKFTPEEAAAINAIFEHDKAILKHWATQLEEAKRQVEYWTSQSNASSALATRVTMQSWGETKKPPATQCADDDRPIQLPAEDES